MSAQDINSHFQTRHADLQLVLNGMPYSSSEIEDNDERQSSLVEGVFLGAYTAFEYSLERIFIHYAIGDSSSKGFKANTRLTRCTEGQARTIIKADQRYIDWSSPSIVRERASRFFEAGEPFLDILGPRSDILSEAEKIRNRIAHESIEAKNAMKEVERVRFLTERTFSMRAGQLLRARRRSKPPMSIVAEHMSILAEIIDKLANVP